jgi:hypothetical protein
VQGCWFKYARERACGVDWKASSEIIFFVRRGKIMTDWPKITAGAP